MLVGGEVFFAAAEDNLQSGKVAGRGVGGVEPVFEGGWEVVAI